MASSLYLRRTRALPVFAAFLILFASALPSADAELAGQWDTTSTAPRAAGQYGPAYTVWTTGGTAVRGTGRARSFGTQFHTMRTGNVTALRFFKVPGDRGPHQGRLFTAGGRLLARVSFRDESSRGWQRAALTRPVSVRRGVEYVVAYRSPTGTHARGQAVLGSGRVATRGSLVATAGRTGAPRQLPGTKVSASQLVDVAYRPRVGPFPDAGSTGAPETGLQPYSGPCSITEDGTVIDAKVVDCDLSIRAADVVVRRSVINGTISSGGDPSSRYSFALVHSTLDVSPDGARLETGVGSVHFRVIGSEIRGGNRGINCWFRCVVRDTWVHGQDTDDSGQAHESGIRMGTHGVFRNNSIGCDAPDVAPDAGCSAPLTGYGDFGPVVDNLVDGNLFLATTGGTCAYGGSSPGKPYSDGAANVRFIDNVFERGDSGNCGFWEPIMDFDPSRPGNSWVGNFWQGGGGRVTP